MKEYKKRIADKLLKYRLEEVGAVLVEGPKWCGKTTTAEQLAKSVLYMADPSTRNSSLEMADLNVRMLLKGDVPRLIDEWQVIPQIWRSTIEEKKACLYLRGRLYRCRQKTYIIRERVVLHGLQCEQCRFGSQVIQRAI